MLQPYIESAIALSDKLELAKTITPLANGELLLKRSSTHSYSFPVRQQFCLLSDLLTAMVAVLFKGEFQGQFIK